MKSVKLSLFIITAFLLCAVLSAKAQDIKEQNLAPNEDVILQWNRVLSQTVAIPGAQPSTILTQRSFAMMHTAMFDAVNSIDGSYKPYLTEVFGFENRSFAQPRLWRHSFPIRQCRRTIHRAQRRSFRVPQLPHAASL